MANRTQKLLRGLLKFLTTYDLSSPETRNTVAKTPEKNMSCKTPIPPWIDVLVSVGWRPFYKDIFDTGLAEQHPQDVALQRAEAIVSFAELQSEPYRSRLLEGIRVDGWLWHLECELREDRLQGDLIQPYSVLNERVERLISESPYSWAEERDARILPIVVMLLLIGPAHLIDQLMKLLRIFPKGGAQFADRYAAQHT